MLQFEFACPWTGERKQQNGSEFPVRLVKSGYAWFIFPAIAAMPALPFTMYADALRAVAGGASISTVATVIGTACGPKASTKLPLRLSLTPKEKRRYLAMRRFLWRL